MDALLKLLYWFVPPTGHDPGVELLYRWRVAVFGCISFALASWFAASMVLEWGFPMIRPASAQTVRVQVASVKRDVASSLVAVQDHLDVIERQQHDDRVERLDQQLLWYRQQNCKIKGALGKGLYMQKIEELKERYTAITRKDWQMPLCSDLGE